MIPMLPPEIISHIVKLALPPFRQHTVVERLRILCAFSLLRKLAQAQMFASVVVGRRETKDLLLRALTDRPTLASRINHRLSARRDPAIEQCDGCPLRLVHAAVTPP
jgi:hypothetical protein